MASSRPAGPSRNKLRESCVALIRYRFLYKFNASLKNETETGRQDAMQRMGVTVRTGRDKEFPFATLLFANCTGLVLGQENPTFALQFAYASVSFALITASLRGY